MTDTEDKKIEELTPEQEAQIPIYRDKWIAYGLSTEDSDLDTVRTIIADVYKEKGYTPPPPEMIFLVDSPLQAAYKRHELEHGVDSVPTPSQLQENINHMIFGNHEAGWFCFYEFFLEVLGLECCEPLRPLMRLAKNAGWWAPYEDYAIVQRRPEKIKLDENGQLHCEDGPAIRFRDGFSVYAWRGVRIPSNWIEDTENLAPETALNWSNMEQRNAACEIIGWHKILDKLDAKVIDKDDDPQIGELLTVELPEHGPAKFVKVFDPCGKRVHALRVPDNMSTALEAVAWTYGMKPHEYKPEVRT